MVMEEYSQQISMPAMKLPERSCWKHSRTITALRAQQTLFAMGDAVLAKVNDIEEISLTMPNLHRLPFNLEPLGDGEQERSVCGNERALWHYQRNYSAQE